MFCFLRSENLLPKVFSLSSVAEILGTKETQECREGAPKVLKKEWKTEALPYISPCFNTFVLLFLPTQLTSPGLSRIDASTEAINPSPELIKIIRAISNH